MTKEDYELLSRDRDCVFSLMLPFVLLPTKVDAVTQEKCCKVNAVGTFDSDNGKIVLILLAEVIAFHVGLTTIDVR